METPMADEDKLADALIASMPTLRPEECLDHEAYLRWLLAEKIYEIGLLKP